MYKILELEYVNVEDLAKHVQAHLLIVQAAKQEYYYIKILA